MEAVESVMGTNESTGLPHGACDASQRGAMGLVCPSAAPGGGRDRLAGRRVAATPEWIGIGLD
jgi:hypothetical protein